MKVIKHPRKAAFHSVQLVNWPKSSSVLWPKMLLVIYENKVTCHLFYKNNFQGKSLVHVVLSF